jgi:predicted amidophosphoribosyltransferase
MAKKKDVFEEEEEEVTCPVCSKPVGLNVPSCPHCGAEFEEVEAEEGAPAGKAPEEEGETAECPVCGKSVSLDITSCPYCGAEFEEEEV